MAAAEAGLSQVPARRIRAWSSGRNTVKIVVSNDEWEPIAAYDLDCVTLEREVRKLVGKTSEVRGAAALLGAIDEAIEPLRDDVLREVERLHRGY